jgi:hypothetical protein
MMTKKYNVRAMIEVGMTPVEETYQNVESNEVVKTRLTAIAEAVQWEMSQDIEEMGFSVKEGLKVNAPEKGNILSVSLEVPRKSENTAIDFLSKVTNRVVRDHNRIFNQIEHRIKSNIANKELKLQNLNTEGMNLERKKEELKRQYEKEYSASELEILTIEVQTANLQDKIADLKRDYDARVEEKRNQIMKLENTIQNVLSQQKALLETKRLLEEESQALTKRIEEAKAQYENLANSKLAANEEGSGPGAVALMLFSNEVLRMQNHISQLEDRKLLQIPKELVKLDVELEKLQGDLLAYKAEKEYQENLLVVLKTEHEEKVQEIERNIEKLNETKALGEKKLAFLEPELEDKIQEIEAQLKKLEVSKQEVRLGIEGDKNRLENMIRTSVIVEPNISLNPTSNVKLIVALGLVGGFFLAVFLAFMAEFWYRNKQKITG